MSDSDLIHVFIVEDHAMVREGFKMLCGEHSDLTVIDEASGMGEGISKLRERESEIDVMVVDISLGDGSGLELLKQVRTEGFEVPVLVVTRHSFEVYGVRVLRAGANGFVEKGQNSDRILEAVRGVADGEVVVPEALKHRVLGRFTGDAGGEDHPLAGLNDRELEIFKMMGEGKSSSEIAEALHLSPKTVHTYRQRIKDKLEIDSMSALVRDAVLWVEKRE